MSCIPILISPMHDLPPSASHWLPYVSSPPHTPLQDYRDHLLEVIPVANLPEMYGGTSKLDNFKVYRRLTPHPARAEGSLHTSIGEIELLSQLVVL